MLARKLINGSINKSINAYDSKTYNYNLSKDQTAENILRMWGSNLLSWHPSSSSSPLEACQVVMPGVSVNHRFKKNKPKVWHSSEYGLVLHAREAKFNFQQYMVRKYLWAQPWWMPLPWSKARQFNNYQVCTDGTNIAGSGPYTKKPHP